MSFTTTQSGQRVFLNAIVNDSVMRLHLYANDRTPSPTDTIAQYTELVFVGYAAKLLTPSEWVIAIDDLTDTYVATFPRQTFTFDDSVTVYGYYITSGTNVVIAERFPNAPVTLTGTALRPTESINITPTIGMR